MRNVFKRYFKEFTPADIASCKTAIKNYFWNKKEDLEHD